MAFEYYLHTDCPIQTELDSDDFRKAAKVKSMLEVIEARRDQCEREGCNLEKVELNLPFAVQAGGLGTKTKLTVSQLRTAWQQTENKARAICPDCPLNIRKTPLGCYGAVTYPLSEAGEAWLMNQFDPPEGEESYLPHHLVSSGVTGEQLDRARSRADEEHPGLLDGGRPIRKRLSSKGPEYSSSQILEYLFRCQPVLIPQTLFGLCIDLRAVDASGADLTSIHAFLAMESMLGAEVMAEKNGEDWKKEMTDNVVYLLRPDPSDDATIHQLKALLFATWTAFRKCATFVIDG